MGPRAEPGRGLLLVARVSAATAAGVALAARRAPVAWAAGELLLAVAFVQWFVLLHECGHGTLTGLRRVDRTVGRIAGVLALIPFAPWCLVHARHHRWTGFQDLDPTTEALAPRPRSRLSRALVDLAWASGLPVVAVVYRAQNYWHLPRLVRLSPRRALELAPSVLAVAALWGALLALLGAREGARLLGPALLLAFVVEEQLIVSQHTHVPQRLARGERVRPIPAADQERFTRSLVVPAWVSRLLLLGIERHELHHAHPLVPGYRLHEIARPTANAVPWWRFVLGARRLRGSIFLYENRDATGAAL
jgi:omega-6 fatty acid desaturase (delta-12 desaturase)